LSIVLFSGISCLHITKCGSRSSTTATIPTNTGNYCSTIITPAPPPLLGLGAAGGGSASETGMVMIPLSSDNNDSQCTNRHSAVEDDEDAMMALESVDQELRSAATAAGMSVENTIDGKEDTD
jgi:hypothetical protein